MLILGLLAVQFTFGMINNLFVRFPGTIRPDLLWAYARSQLSVVSHIVVGTLLLVSAVIFLIRVSGKPYRRWLGSAVVGLIAIVIAIYGGVTFVTTQVDTYSLVIALGFIIAVLAYSWALHYAWEQA